MRGKTVVITGGTSGIGEVAAVALAKMGARIVLVARDKSRGDATLARLRDSAPGIAHSIHFADLLRLAEMKRVAAQIADREPRIDILINNAGALFATRQLTEDGLERTWAVLRPPAAQRATGLRQQPARNRTDNGGRLLLLLLARRTALKDQRNSGLVCFFWRRGSATGCSPKHGAERSAVKGAAFALMARISRVRARGGAERRAPPVDRPAGAAWPPSPVPEFGLGLVRPPRCRDRWCGRRRRASAARYGVDFDTTPIEIALNWGALTLSGAHLYPLTRGRSARPAGAAC